MTRKTFVWSTVAVIAVYAFAITVGVILRVQFPGEHNSVYDTYKDMIPLIIALPAAYLAYVIQSRASYLTALRAAWGKIADAVAAAIVYTELPSPNREEHIETLRKLSAVIEEVRGLYKNVRAKGAPDGWYPFEPIKQIYLEIKKLGSGSPSAEDFSAAATNVYQFWKACRAPFLAELDIDKPTYHHALYASTGSQRP
jgi:hypothetical protein